MPEFEVDVLIKLVDEVSGAASSIKSALSDINAGVSETANNTSMLQNALSTAAGVMIRDLAQDSLSAVTSSASDASDSFMEYEQTLTKIISASGATGDETRVLRDALAATSEAQTDLGFSGREAASGLEALVKAGMDGDSASQALTSALSLARLENIDTETAAGLLVQTLTMFNMNASQSGDALNLISKAADAGIGSATDYASGLSNCGASAANMGMSLEDTLGGLVILDKTFGSAVESGTYMNAMFKDLVTKSDELGLSLYNSDGSMKSLDQIVQQLKSNIQSYGGDQEAVNNYLSTFDVRAQRAVIGLTNYDGSIGDVTDSMASSRDVQDKVNMVMDTSTGTMAKLTAEQENVNYQFGEMTTNLELTWKQFALNLGPIGGVVDALGPSMLQGALTGVMMILPQVILSVGGMVTSYGIADTASMVLASGTGILTTALDFLAANPIVLVVGALAALAAGLWYAYNNCEPVRDALNTLGSVLGGALSTAIETVKNGLQWVWDNVLVPLGEFIAGAFMGYIQGWIDIWNALKRAADPVFTALESFWNNVLVPLGNYIVDVFKAAWDTLGTAIMGVYNTYIKPVFDALQAAYDTVLKPIGDFLGGIGSALGGVGDAIGSALGFTSDTQSGSSAARQARIDEILTQNAEFATALQEGRISSEEYNFAMATQETELAKAKAMATGGIVTSPTLALIGESGPEAVVPLNESAYALGDFSGLSASEQKQEITVYNTIEIGNISSDVDLAQVQQAVSSGVAEGFRRRR